jgi:hypothetical protein
MIVEPREKSRRERTHSDEGQRECHVLEHTEYDEERQRGDSYSRNESKKEHKGDEMYLFIWNVYSTPWAKLELVPFICKSRTYE